MIVTYACVQNTNLATIVLLTEEQKYLRTIPAQMEMLKCYMFFLEIKAVVLNIQFLKLNNFINIDMFISYFLIISKKFIQSGSPWLRYKNLSKVPEISSSDNNWSTSHKKK